MALKKVGEGVSSWNNKIPFPKDRYACTCIEESLEKSQGNNNPMVKRVWEIVNPEYAVGHDGRNLAVSGLKITTYRVIKVHLEDEDGWDKEKSEKAFNQFVDELLAGGFSEVEVDDENPPLFFKNKTMDCIVSAKKDVARKLPTQAELKEGKRVGAEIKDASGNPIETYQLIIDTILGPSSTKVDVAY